MFRWVDMSPIGRFSLGCNDLVAPGGPWLPWKKRQKTWTHGGWLKGNDADPLRALQMLGVVLAGEFLAKLEVELLGHLGHAVFVDERKDAELDGGELGLDRKIFFGALAAFVVAVGFAEDDEDGAGEAAGGFDDVGDVAA